MSCLQIARQFVIANGVIYGAHRGAGGFRPRPRIRGPPRGRARAGAQRESHYVQSLARGLSVITAFGPDTPELSLSDVARATA